ncbi:chlorophyll synthase ChlG [Cylindrospermum sp. FACHB-282]|uniref:chlorophyll synthase ChlG n=1 Tax=Cylindrospermum sp. FACHB-282 TaxID=2692794 RepID=UPI001689DDE8|nr:chlorophyll synthase ChlG [Cylindrospermum sp. FACHB-282]MBD2388187.1 chlorophyll synthase ChlG [Cylindrospermum sp. FACHB-282]
MSESTPITPNPNPSEALDSVVINPSDQAIATATRSAKTRQMLGMKGAAPGETSIWKIRLQLMKPITWIPLIWGVVCGAASSGNYIWSLENVLKAATCMLLSGPLLAGYTQTLNDYYDREIDAINEPYRPIPSGVISERQVITQIVLLFLSGIGLAFILDVWAGHEFPNVTALAVFGCFIAYIYSAPPLKLKQNGWLGNYALGASYIALPWWAGHALFGDLNWKIVVLTLFYSLAGLGIAIVNDFKSVEGDRQLGLQSLPVMFGITTASWICVVMIDLFQGLVAAYLVSIHENLYAAILVLLIIPQITLQDMYFLRDPVANDVKYQASAQPFLVLGMLITGLALGHAGV